MMNSIKIDYIISDNYRDLINKDIYENIILKIMNESNVVFNGLFKHNEKQSNGESDFESLLNGELIDAKTIFPQQQCENLSLGKIEDFYKMICVETNDIFEVIMNNKDLSSTILYKQITEAFEKINTKENIIVFIPFPFTLELEDLLSSRFSSDIFSQIVFKMKNAISFFNNHIVYFIYPNLENKIILKNISTGDIEYLNSNIISKYIFVKYRGDENE